MGEEYERRLIPVRAAAGSQPGLRHAARGGLALDSLVWRTWRAAGLSQLAAKRQMWWGLAVRLGMLTGVLLVAVKISVPVFYGTVLGFGLCYGLAMAQFLRLAWEQNKHGGRA